MPTLEIGEYVDAQGRSRFARWFEQLDGQAAAKVTTALARLELGNPSNAGTAGRGVPEYRVNFGPGCRICFGRDGGVLIVL